MGYYGKLQEKNEAIKLRERGFSYNEIMKKVFVSKSTLSLWCRDITLTASQEERLQKKKLMGAELGRTRGAKRQQRRRIRVTQDIILKAIKAVGKLNKRERFVAGIGLYLGDGNKGDRGVGFSNANPEIIKFMVNWFEEFLQDSNKKIKCALWLHDNLDENKAKKFWSEYLGIPESQFTKTYVAKNIENSKKIRKNIHEYGIISMRIHCKEMQRTMRGYMKGILTSY